MGALHNVESIFNAVKQAIVEEGFEESTNDIAKYFSTAGKQATMLEKIGFTVSGIIQFDRPTELVGEDGMKNWIIQFAQSLFINIPVEKVENIIDKAVVILKETNYKNVEWYADYKRLRIKAINKSYEFKSMRPKKY